MGSSGLLENETAPTFAATDKLVANATLTGGTSILAIYAFGANNRAAGTRSEGEVLLKPDTQYAMKMTADGVTNAGWIALHWYEHTDGA